MTYTINKTNGDILAVVDDGTIEQISGLWFIGRNYAGYGEFLNENFVQLLENFSNSDAPNSPVEGQIWWDSDSNLLKVYTGTLFKTVSSSTASENPPVGPTIGDLWWDTANRQLKVFDGSEYAVIGPLFSTGTGLSGAIIETITDSDNNSHLVVSIYISNVRVGIVSNDEDFVPQATIPGFLNVRPGFNLADTGKFQGTAINSDALGGAIATNYLRSDQNDTTSGKLSILNDAGIDIGVDNDLSITVDSNNVKFSNRSSNGDIQFEVNESGTTEVVMTIDGGTGRISVAGDPTIELGIATKQYVDTSLLNAGLAGVSDVLLLTGGTMTGNILSSDGSQDIGSLAEPFSDIYADDFRGTHRGNVVGGTVSGTVITGNEFRGGTFSGTTYSGTTFTGDVFSGTASRARYADIAENFRADDEYEPGTVVSLGGKKEITISAKEGDENVFGVVSENPAYLMNSELSNGIPIAMAGRVRVKTTGKVRKGDRLISAGNGRAKAAKGSKLTHWNVIGRSLENIDVDGMVEAVVVIK